MENVIVKGLQGLLLLTDLVTVFVPKNLGSVRGVESERSAFRTSRYPVTRDPKNRRSFGPFVVSFPVDNVPDGHRRLQVGEEGVPVVTLSRVPLWCKRGTVH